MLERGCGLGSTEIKIAELLKILTIDWTEKQRRFWLTAEISDVKKVTHAWEMGAWNFNT